MTQTDLGYGVTLVVVTGDLGLATRAEFATALRTVVERPAPHTVVVDPNRVSFLAACALAVLQRAARHADSGGGSLVVVLAPTVPAVRTTTRVSRTGLVVHPTVPAALATAPEHPADPAGTDFDQAGWNGAGSPTVNVMVTGDGPGRDEQGDGRGAREPGLRGT